MLYVCMCECFLSYILPPPHSSQDIRVWVQGKTEAEVVDLFLQVKDCLVSSLVYPGPGTGTGHDLVLGLAMT